MNIINFTDVNEARFKEEGRGIGCGSVGIRNHSKAEEAQETQDDITVKGNNIELSEAFSKTVITYANGRKITLYEDGSIEMQAPGDRPKKLYFSDDVDHLKII